MNSDKFLERFFLFFNFRHALLAIGIMIFLNSILPVNPLTNGIKLLLLIPTIMVSLLLLITIIGLWTMPDFKEERWGETKELCSILWSVFTKIYPILIGISVMYYLTNYATHLALPAYWLLVSLTLLLLLYAPWAYNQFDKNGLKAELW